MKKITVTVTTETGDPRRIHTIDMDLLKGEVRTKDMLGDTGYIRRFMEEFMLEVEKSIIDTMRSDNNPNAKVVLKQKGIINKN